jgi:hypothetical protein
MYNNRGTVGSVGPCRDRIWRIEKQARQSLDMEAVKTRVEADSNTSTVNLRVVGGDEKGSLRSETVKEVNETKLTRTRERLRWRGPAAYTKDRPVFSSERAPHKNKSVTVNV